LGAALQADGEKEVRVGGLKHQKEKRGSIGIRYPGFSMRQVLARRRDYERSRRRTREDFFVSLPVHSPKTPKIKLIKNISKDCSSSVFL
jgi:hypothetical protein